MFVNVEKIINKARDYKEKYPNSTLLDFLELNNYTKKALGQFNYSFLVNKLSKIFGLEADAVKLYLEID